MIDSAIFDDVFDDDAKLYLRQMDYYIKAYECNVPKLNDLV